MFPGTITRNEISDNDNSTIDEQMLIKNPEEKAEYCQIASCIKISAVCLDTKDDSGSSIIIDKKCSDSHRNLKLSPLLQNNTEIEIYKNCMDVENKPTLSEDKTVESMTQEVISESKETLNDSVSIGEDHSMNSTEFAENKDAECALSKEVSYSIKSKKSVTLDDVINALLLTPSYFTKLNKGKGNSKYRELREDSSSKSTRKKSKNIKQTLQDTKSSNETLDSTLPHFVVESSKDYSIKEKISKVPLVKTVDSTEDFVPIVDKNVFYPDLSVDGSIQSNSDRHRKVKIKDPHQQFGGPRAKSSNGKQQNANEPGTAYNEIVKPKKKSRLRRIRRWFHKKLIATRDILICKTTNSENLKSP